MVGTNKLFIVLGGAAVFLVVVISLFMSQGSSKAVSSSSATASTAKNTGTTAITGPDANAIQPDATKQKLATKNITATAKPAANTVNCNLKPLVKVLPATATMRINGTGKFNIYVKNRNNLACPIRTYTAMISTKGGTVKRIGLQQLALAPQESGTIAIQFTKKQNIATLNVTVGKTVATAVISKPAAVKAT